MPHLQYIEQHHMNSEFKLSDLLGLRDGICSVIGSGGKTSLINILAAEAQQKGQPCIISTSTHILLPQHGAFIRDTELEQLKQVLAQEGLVTVGHLDPLEPHKLSRPQIPGLNGYEEAHDGYNQVFRDLLTFAQCKGGKKPLLLIEADGSRGLPLKAHAAYEPVVPADSSTVIQIVGASGFGKLISKAVHRPKLFCQALGLVPLLNNKSSDEKGCTSEANSLSFTSLMQFSATPELVAEYIAQELKISAATILINQIDSEEKLALAQIFSEALAEAFEEWGRPLPKILGISLKNWSEQVFSS